MAEHQVDSGLAVVPVCDDVGRAIQFFLFLDGWPECKGQVFAVATDATKTPSGEPLTVAVLSDERFITSGDEYHLKDEDEEKGQDGEVPGSAEAPVPMEGVAQASTVLLDIDDGLHIPRVVNLAYHLLPVDDDSDETVELFAALRRMSLFSIALS